MSLTITNPGGPTPTYTFSGGTRIDYYLNDTGTYDYSIVGGGTYVALTYQNIVPVPVTQTGNILYEAAANTQTFDLISGILTNTGVNAQTVGTKTFILRDNVQFTTGTFSGNCNIYVGSNAILNVTTFSGTGVIYVGYDTNSVIKNSSRVTIGTINGYSIQIYGSNCTVNVSSCTNLTVQSGAYDNLINGTNNQITNNAGAVSTSIYGTQTSVTDNGINTQKINTGQTQPSATTSTFGNLNLAANTLSSTNTNGNIVLAPNGTGQLQLGGAGTITTTTTNSNLVLSANGTGTVVLNGRSYATDSATLDGMVTNVNNTYLVSNSVLAYWDGLNNPSTAGFSSPQGTLTGTAVYIDSTSGVRLTLNGTGGSSGSINFNFRHLDYMRVQFQAQATGAADACWFYCFADGVPTTEYGTGITAGYIVSFSEFHQQICLNWGVGSDFVGPAYGNTLAYFNSVTDLATSTWHDFDIRLINSRIQVYYKAALVIDYQDVYTRSHLNQNFGFAARTGGSSATHLIKNFVVTKLGVEPSAFNVANVTPITNSLMYDRVNGRIGINTSAPAFPLDVTGAANVSGAVTAGGAISTTAGNISTSAGNISTASGSVTASAAVTGATVTGTTSVTAGTIGVNVTANAITNTSALTISTTAGALVLNPTTTIQLSKNLDIGANSIFTTATNGNITLTPSGSGNVVVAANPTTALGVATKQYVDALVFGTQYQVVVSEAASTQTSSTFGTKLTITTPTIPAGTYRISWSYKWNIQSTTTRMQVQVTVDATQVDLMDATNNVSNAALRFPASGFVNATLTNATHNILLQYASQNNASTVTIAAARMEFWRIS